MTRFKLFLVILCLLLPLPSWAGDVIGEVIGMSGEVSVRDDKAQRFAARIGMQLETGQMMKTGENATVEILLADGAAFRIAANSSFIIDDFLISGDEERSMTARMLNGAMQYLSIPASFKRDDRKIYLANAVGAVRGTNFIAFVGPQIEAILISGKVEISSRSNRVTLNRRGHAVFLSRTGDFDNAFVVPDAQLVQLGDRLGWRIKLPPPPEEDEGALGIDPIPCVLSGGYLYCG